MTVSSELRRVVHGGNGVTTSWPFGFRIFKQTDLKVTLVNNTTGVETVLTLTTHYTVSGAGSYSGGSVAYPLSGSPLATGFSLVLERVMPLTQLTDFRNQSRFFPETHENQFDRDVMMIQQVAAGSEDALKLNAAETAWDADGIRIEDLDEGVDADDAVNLGQLEAAIAGVAENGGVTPRSWTDTGTGVATEFNLAGADVATALFYDVFIDGVRQVATTDYSISISPGPKIVFTSAPGNGAVVYVVLRGYAKGAQGDAAQLRADLASTAAGFGADLVGNTSRYFSSIAALRTAHTPSANRPAIVGSYYGDGDTFSSSIFLWHASSTEADNGVTVIQVSGVVNGRYKLRHNDRIDARQAGVKVDDSTNNLAALQAAVDAVKCVVIAGGGTARMSGGVANLNAGNHVIIESGTTLRQMTADNGCFTATQKDNVVVENHGVMYGPGVWSAGWVGNSGHNERGVQFLGCTRSHLIGGGAIKNFGHAGVGITGGNNIIVKQRIEGTHGYGQNLSSGDNFQMGVTIHDDPTYGSPTGIDIDCDISGTAQGIVRERNNFATDNAGSLKIRGYIHDIPGQHGIYITDGNVDAEYTYKNIALSACKLSSAINGNLSNIRARIVGNNTESHGFEVEVVGTGSTTNVNLVGVIDDAGGAALGIACPSGSVANLNADIVCRNVGKGFQSTGTAQTDIQVRINGKTIQTDGVLITATNSTYKIWPTLRNPNTSNTANTYGILLASASSTLELFDPDVTDANTRMVYGLFNSVDGGIVKVYGKAVFTGASDTAIRATGKITEFPAVHTLSGTNGKYTGRHLISSSDWMNWDIQSTSGSNVQLWYLALDDESAYHVEAMIVGKLAGSAERAAYTMSALFYRNGGVATQQGATDTDVSIASGGFAGALAFGVDGGNQALLNVNSGGAATYDWSASVKVTKVVG